VQRSQGDVGRSYQRVCACSAAAAAATAALSVITAAANNAADTEEAQRRRDADDDARFESRGKQLGAHELQSDVDTRDAARTGLWVPGSIAPTSTPLPPPTVPSAPSLPDADALEKPSIDLFRAIFGENWCCFACGVCNQQCTTKAVATTMMRLMLIDNSHNAHHLTTSNRPARTNRMSVMRRRATSSFGTRDRSCLPQAHRRHRRYRACCLARRRV
jgi:hypothetical protein